MIRGKNHNGEDQELEMWMAGVRGRWWGAKWKQLHQKNNKKKCEPQQKKLGKNK